MNILIKNTKFRYAFSFAVLAISLLLLGAGKMSGEKKTLSKRAENISVCRVTCRQFVSAVPDANRAAWKKMIQRSPELALRSGSVNLHELNK